MATAATYTAAQKDALISEVSKDIEISQNLIKVNQGWDLFFKVGLLAFAVLSTIGGAVITTKYREKPAPNWLSITTVSSSTIVATISAFAFTQMNFAARSTLYAKKTEGLRYLQFQLKYDDPSKDKFSKALTTIRSWNDSTQPSVEIPVIEGL
ncbi:MAG: hypothetical protein HC930_00875 [Hydrococcus sp. SU_1_0]|nr:hypothetical protein [Hydrococcus sp. SU_1_0]